MNTDIKYILVHLTAGIKNLRIWSGLLAILMTMLMFYFMLALTGPERIPPVRKRLAMQNNEIIISEPDTPLDLKEPEPQEPLSKKLHILVSPLPSKKLRPGTNLAFEVNQRLTSGTSVSKIPAQAIAVSLNMGRPYLFGISDLDQPLISVKRFPPVYPLQAKQKRIQGYVTIQFVVNIHGAVEDVTVIESNPSGVFDQSVITCVSDWLFKPGAVNGEAVNTLAQTTVNFELEQN